MQSASFSISLFLRSNAYTHLVHSFVWGGSKKYILHESQIKVMAIGWTVIRVFTVYSSKNHKTEAWVKEEEHES